MHKDKKLSEMPMWAKNRTTKEMEEHGVGQAKAIRRSRGDELSVDENGMFVTSSGIIDPKKIGIYRCSECPCLCKDGCNEGNQLLSSLVCASGVHCPEDPDFPAGWCHADGSSYFDYQIEGIELTSGLSDNCSEIETLILSGPSADAKEFDHNVDSPTQLWSYNEGCCGPTKTTAHMRQTGEAFYANPTLGAGCGWTGIHHHWPYPYFTTDTESQADSGLNSGYGLGTVIRDFTSIKAKIEYHDCPSGDQIPPCRGSRGAYLDNYWLHEGVLDGSVPGGIAYSPTGSPGDVKEVEVFFDLHAEIKFSCISKKLMSSHLEQSQDDPDGHKAIKEPIEDHGSCNVIFTLLLHESGRVWPEEWINEMIAHSKDIDLFTGAGWGATWYGDGVTDGIVNSFNFRNYEDWYNAQLADGFNPQRHASQSGYAVPLSMLFSHYGAEVGARGGPISQRWTWSTLEPVDGVHAEDGGHTYELHPVSRMGQIWEVGAAGTLSPGDLDPMMGQKNHCVHGVGESGRCYEDIDKLLCGPLGFDHSSNVIKATYLPQNSVI